MLIIMIGYTVPMSGINYGTLLQVSEVFFLKILLMRI